MYAKMRQQMPSHRRGTQAPGRPPKLSMPRNGRPRVKGESPELERLRLANDDLRLENQHLVEALRVLEESLNRYAQYYDEAPVASISLDRTGMIREINKTALTLFADQRAHLLGVPLRTRVLVEDRPAFAVHLHECRKAGAATTRLRILVGDGQST